MQAVDPRLSAIHNSLYRVSVKAVIVDHGRLLMTLETSGWYNLPGGGLDYHETIADALLRELKEEVGIEAEDVQLTQDILAVTHRGISRGIPRLQVYYRASISNANALKHGELEYKWVSAEELKNLPLSPVIQADRDFLLAQIH